MAIVSGYQKMKDYIKQSSGYKLLSRWANANTLECDDGKTLQNKVGGISGISSSLTANSTTQAASTNLTNQLYQNITQVSSELKFPDGTKFYPDIKDGEYGFNTAADRGADTFHPFKKSFSMTWHHNAQANVVAGLYSSIDLPGSYSTLKITPKTVSPGNTTIAFKVNGETKQTITSAGATIDLTRYNADIVKLEIFDPYNGRVEVVSDIELS